VLVDVIFETIERIREQDDTVLLMEQHAPLTMLGDASKLLYESFVTAANLEGHW
jgi:ABC-type branched-subunit amino acid transport system ATPase component